MNQQPQQPTEKQEWWIERFDREFSVASHGELPLVNFNLRVAKSFISHVAEEERRRGREEENKKWGAFLQKLAWKEDEIRNAWDWVERTPLRLESDFTLSRIEQNLNSL